MVPSFSAFYRSVHGYEPFPWQARLAERVATTGWPDALDIPTGLGKTAAIDIAVWALAHQAGRAPSERTAATRTWWVVDRRLLIDAAFDHGDWLATILHDPAALRGRGDAHGREVREEDVDAVRAVGEALRTMARFGTDRPLHVVRLRGGAALGNRAPDPSQPALIFATVAMYASRLLFRGYGTGRLARPMDAALAGTDSLVLLDEAHIARPLIDLVEAAAECDLGDPTRLMPAGRARPRLVAVSATGDRTADPFGLGDDDRVNPIVAQRLRARKLTVSAESDRGGLIDTLAAQGIDVSSQSASTVVFCNTAAGARRVFQRIFAKAPPTTDVRLLTGRMREREAAAARADILRRAGAGRELPPDDRRLLVVATQTLEVGADLDFDGLVTECAGRRAIVQRFGRLNRLGRFDRARAVICGPPDPDHPLYGGEARDVWDILEGSGGAVDLGPEAITEVLGPPKDVAPRHPELLPTHLWEYAKTGIDEIGQPDVELFFTSADDRSKRVSVLWRAHFSYDDEQSRLFPPVSEQEIIDLPISEMRQFLSDRDRTDVHRVDGGVAIERVPAQRIRPGDTLLLDAELGGYDEYGWTNESRDPVVDVRALHWPLLWLTSEGVANVAGREMASTLSDELRTIRKWMDDGSRDLDDLDRTVGDVVATLQAATPVAAIRADEWTALIAAIGECCGRGPTIDEFGPRLEGPRSRRRPMEETLRADAFDDWSFDIQSATLLNHLGAVGEASADVAARLGLPKELVEIVSRAGELHDLGKADDRFQRLLDPDGSCGELMAKSTSPRRPTTSRADWPRGGRHELLSGQALATFFAHDGASLETADADLLLHLVVSHHGHGRPIVPAVPNALTVEFEVTMGGRPLRVAGNLGACDWDQPARFRRLCERYGCWGLALLETIVRQSDHAVSAMTAATVDVGTAGRTAEVV